MNRPARKSLLVGLVWGMLALSLVGQDRARNPSTESHIPLPPGSTNRADAERLLRERLGKAQDFHKGNEQLQKLLEQIQKDPSKYFSPEQLKQLKDKLPPPGEQDPRSLDPELVRVLQEWAKKQKQLPQNQGQVPQLENLERLLEEQARNNSKKGSNDPPKVGATPPTPAPPPIHPQPSPADQKKDVQLRKGIVKAAERFLDRSKNSDTLKRAEQDLLRPSSRWGEDWVPFAKAREGLRSELPDVGKSLRLDRLVKEGDRLFRGTPNWPEIGDSRDTSPFRGGSPGGGLPAISPPEVGEASGVSLLLWLVVGVALAALLWKIMSASRRSRDEKEEAWKLGSWPVNPGAVATRDELVRAFDYLTLLCLGPPARFWNHREIGHRLGNDQAQQRQQAAEALTELYEQARYAPPDELLPPGEMETARRHLCFLAGASAA